MPDPLNLKQVMLSQESSYGIRYELHPCPLHSGFFYLKNMAESEKIIILNGKAFLHIPRMTVASLIAAVYDGSGAVVAEVNGVIVSREKYPETSINPGDVVELVHFVGGG